MTRRQGLWMLGIASLALLATLAIIDREIQASGGPGIIPFELAWSSERSTEILDQWDSDARDAARLSLWLDFPYLAAYGAFFSLAVLAIGDAAGRRGWDRFAAPATALAALPVLAAACDAAENVGLLLILDGRADTVLPVVATGFAVVKFAALATAQLYLLAGLARLAADRIRRPS